MGVDRLGAVVRLRPEHERHHADADRREEGTQHQRVKLERSGVSVDSSGRNDVENREREDERDADFDQLHGDRFGIEKQLAPDDEDDESIE